MYSRFVSSSFTADCSLYECCSQCVLSNLPNYYVLLSLAPRASSRTKSHRKSLSVPAAPTSTLVESTLVESTLVESTLVDTKPSATGEVIDISNLPSDDDDDDVKPSIEPVHGLGLPPSGHKFANDSNTSTIDQNLDAKDLRSLLRNAHAKISTLASQLDMWKQNAAVCAKSNENLKRELEASKEVNARNVDLASQLDALKTQLAVNAAMSNEANDRNAKLTTQLDALKEVVAVTRRELDASKVQNAELTAQLDASKEVVDATKVRNAELAVQLEKVTAQFHAVQAERNALSMDLEASRREILALESRLATIREYAG
jgi:uncharacterized phage infection (PIP) family protein YhgE